MEIRFCASINDIDASHWDSLAKGNQYPFTRHAFLAALEDSKSCSRETGWQPYHASLWENDLLIAAMPLYLKNHSYGEYVFDWAWADAYQRNNRDYYPKLITCIPFTPASGPRILCARPLEQVLPILVEAIQGEALRLGCSSWHCLFPHTDVHNLLTEQSISARLGSQFHWFNRDYENFDDFLSTFTSRKRKNLRKERQKVAEQGITLEVKTGETVSADEWLLFYQLYHRTYFKRSGRQGYLSEAFFELLAENMPEQLVMVIASHDDKKVAAALCFRDSDTLYGRYWGCSEEFDFLHFETCYYQGIEFAIREGLQRFDPGAQGEHKIQRGFEPVQTFSNHWIVAEDFRAAVGDFLLREREGVLGYIADAEGYLPFKKG